jgi:hypothetical protein
VAHGLPQREALLRGPGLGLLLGQPHHGDLGVREAGGRDVLVVDHVRAAHDVLHRGDALCVRAVW